MREATSGRGRRVADVLLRILVSALVIAPISAWSALALWFRLPAPEGLRAAAAIVFAVLGLATGALFLRRGLIALVVFAIAFGGLLAWWSTIKPPLDGDWAPDVATADDGVDRGRYSDALRRSRFRLADRRRLHGEVGQALLRPVEAEDARSLPRLLGRAGDGACHHELRLRGRRAYRVVSRGSAREDRRVLADRRRLQKSHARLSRHHRTRFGQAAHECAGRGRAPLPAQHTARPGSRAVEGICRRIDGTRRTTEILQFDHRELRDRRLQAGEGGREHASL